MTPKQILDSFSHTLMQDERILSAQERALLANLLQRAKASAAEDSETGEAVLNVIASSVGETVAQRAFAVLGRGIVERILNGPSTLLDGESESAEAMIVPKPPGPDPQPPGVKAPKNEPHKQPHKVPHKPAKTPMVPPPPGPDPQPPGPKGPGGPMGTPMVPPPDPQPPAHGIQPTVISKGIAVVERPERLTARCVILDEFLAPQELEELTHFAVEHEADFRESVVISRTLEEGVVDYDHRRSRVLMDVGRHEGLMLERIKSVLPSVLDQLGMEEFAIAGAEVQMTASNDGDFFRFHSDNGSECVASRYLTFVYFFHREPKAFEGGELRIHDARLENGVYVSEGSYQAISPRQNQVVFFPCEMLHEVTTLNCPSQAFADSRFTLNGWLRR